MPIWRKLPFKTILLLGFLFQGFPACQGHLQIVFPDQKEFIINSNSDITLKCEGDKPVTWNYPKSSEEVEEKRSFFHLLQSSTDDVYTALLEIRNISYLDTNFYDCSYDNGDENERQSIYLFVRDEQHLTVSKANVIINVMQGSQAILPCRPTSPDIEVELIRSTGEKVPVNVTVEEGAVYLYDPKYGFIINEVTHEEYQIYDCTFSKDGLIQQINIVLGIMIPTEPVEAPCIEDLNNGHTVVGKTLKLSCLFVTNGKYDQKWIIPNPTAWQDGRVQEKKRYSNTDMRQETMLLIKNATLEDKGRYICVVTDIYHNVSSDFYVQIYDVNEHHIDIYEENGVYEISILADENSSIQWAININAHPIPKLVWYDNRNISIENSGISAKKKKYNVTIVGNKTVLVINNVSIFDRGHYKLKAFNSFEEKYLHLFLNVSGKPSVILEKEDFYVINESGFVQCIASAFPKPSIFWTIETCLDDFCTSQKESSEKIIHKSDFEVISTVAFKPNSSGIFTCYANNSLGDSRTASAFIVTDVKNGFNVWSSEVDIEDDTNMKFSTAALRETITLYCGATVTNYTDQIYWYRTNNSDFSLIESNDRITIHKSHTKYSYRTILTISNLMYSDSGNYTCRGQKISYDLLKSNYIQVALNVKEPQAPVITQSNLNGENFEAILPVSLDLFCRAEGIPKPKIVWLKNKINFMDQRSQSRIEIKDGNQQISFIYTQEEDEGLYTCKAENRYGSAENSVFLNFKNKNKFNYIYLYSAVLVVSLILLSATICIIKQQKEKKILLKELQSAGLGNFKKGNLEILNPELGIDDQAELLPYDEKFEFPREKLKLGKQLGAGAFGVVLKAEAKDIVKGEAVTTVAVKMVKRNADASYIKALVSELKIMVHLGRHLNVVNLLGACTENAAKTRELLVIVEYCRFGNVHNFLIRNRQNFINQIHPKTKKMDFSIGSEFLDTALSISSNKSDYSNYPEENSTLSCTTARTMSTVVCTSPNGDSDGLITSNNSSQPEWRSNYRGDYKEVVNPISTKDLVSWAWQVAKGMEYLVSRKVLHGDLAARNVLLAEKNVVKICDFGLAKSIYKSNNYQKKGDGPLPVKWMAIESIRDRIFSTQSDVWSFGIVLWEFFSLARTPYPGMEADERLYQKLIEGYRMNSPEYAPKEIYQIMLDCWHINPLCRPTFTNLVHQIGVLLEESLRQHYIDLNDPYLKMNTQRLENQEDYLAMLNPPDFINLASPNIYVNESSISNKEDLHNIDAPGYLCMRPSNIFSPTPSNTSVFVFDSNRKPKNNEVSNNGVELVPMLRAHSEFDCESQPGSPSIDSFSNPSYHLPLAVSSAEGDKTLPLTSNVSVPRNAVLKCINTTEDRDNSDNNIEHYYVNSNSRDWESVIK